MSELIHQLLFDHEEISAIEQAAADYLDAIAALPHPAEATEELIAPSMPIPKRTMR